MARRVAIILAAGESTRMKTQKPKVLHEICGRAMLAYVLDACRQADIEKIYVVVGYGREEIIERFKEAEDVVWVHQAEQKGTAHAVMCCEEHLKDFEGRTLVLCGDGPLLQAETLTKLIAKHESENSAATLATAILDEPAGYGRIVRGKNGLLQGIVEDIDCSDEQRVIKEVNPSYYCFENKILFETIKKVTPENAKGEYYLTDVVRLVIDGGSKCAAVTAVPAEDAVSINSRKQLAEVNGIMQRRIQDGLMADGVTIVKPASTWINAGATIGSETIIEPFTFIEGDVTIGRNCRIGPFARVAGGTVLKDGEQV